MNQCPPIVPGEECESARAWCAEHGVAARISEVKSHWSFRMVTGQVVQEESLVPGPLRTARVIGTADWWASGGLLLFDLHLGSQERCETWHQVKLALSRRWGIGERQEQRAETERENGLAEEDMALAAPGVVEETAEEEGSLASPPAAGGG